MRNASFCSSVRLDLKMLLIWVDKNLRSLIFSYCDLEISSIQFTESCSRCFETSRISPVEKALSDASEAEIRLASTSENMIAKSLALTFNEMN
jgi:hypothetical protein